MQKINNAKKHNRRESTNKGENNLYVFNLVNMNLL